MASSSTCSSILSQFLSCHSKLLSTFFQAHQAKQEIDWLFGILAEVQKSRASEKTSMRQTPKLSYPLDSFRACPRSDLESGGLMWSIDTQGDKEIECVTWNKNRFRCTRRLPSRSLSWEVFASLSKILA